MHVAVAGTETDHLAKLINEKAEEVDAACIVMASHGKTSFQVQYIFLVTPALVPRQPAEFFLHRCDIVCNNKVGTQKNGCNSVHTGAYDLKLGSS